MANTTAATDRPGIWNLMATLPITYSGRDFTAEFERLMALLRQIAPEITDQNYAEFSSALVRLVASVSDLHNSYIDQAAQEYFLDWARFKRSMIQKGRTVGYMPGLASSASTRLLLTRITGVTGAIAVPRWTAFGRLDGLEYLTIEEVTIPIGVDSVEVDALQGIAVTRTIQPEEFTIIDWSRRPKVNIGANICAGSVSMWSGDPAVYWTETTTFFRVQAADKVFRLELNGDDDTVNLALGDGTRGVSTPDEPLQIEFIRTAGAAGNGGSGTVTVVPDAYKALITCANIDMCSGGSAAQTSDSIRRELPLVTETQRRGVIKADYDALIAELPGILHCRCYDRENSTYWPHEHVIIYAVPEGGGLMSEHNKAQILQLCQSKGVYERSPVRYVILDAVRKTVNIAARIGVLDGYNSATVGSATGQALAALLAADNQQIEGRVAFADLHRAASAVAGVNWIEFDSPTIDIVCGKGEFPVPGTIQITVV